MIIEMHRGLVGMILFGYTTTGYTIILVCNYPSLRDMLRAVPECEDVLGMKAFLCVGERGGVRVGVWECASLEARPCSLSAGKGHGSPGEKTT